MQTRTKAILRFTAGGIFSWLVAAITGVLGWAPPDILTWVFGTARINSAVTWAESVMNDQFIRWGFIALSYLTFALGISLFLGIPLYTLRQEVKSLGKKFRGDYEGMYSASRAMLRKAAKRERAARDLHNKARKMLGEIRDRKRGDIPTNPPS